MKPDFDKVIDKSGTYALKEYKYRRSECLPMWVADMDFACPEQVLESVKQRAEHPILGYTLAKELDEIITERMDEFYGWKIQPEWIVYTAGVVSGINCSCRAAEKAGRAVVNTPIYPPFLSVPPFQGLSLEKNRLVFSGSKWEIDFEDLQQKLSAGSEALLVFCNPHNPTGRCFNRKELERAAEICLETGSIICSDEIHCELLLGESRHTPIASLGKDIEQNSITMMSPSKTFNLAGMMTGFAIIPNKAIRRRFAYAKENLSSHPNVFGIKTAKAAYQHGENWRKALLEYLTENRNLITERLEQYGIAPASPRPHISTGLTAQILAWKTRKDTSRDSALAFQTAYTLTPRAGLGLISPRPEVF
ncbi:Cystathionine beta-lyase PatB [Sedimentisphaera cyanobacteriorum]|uniref:cysteine-S-conjugate beta-lyase n=1 Tax=Sedimentisphaera cyanobacteriorum TaxID=1940790 RepID=A0A1Q2HR63_9BACT|nr:aminotransferase class I/II-fold pyridoxal phosphate-dependent enzyme [Sedimentisphaera cyanobacteriorum]AQQ09912.1 Cystathionine beta-lyase PatB [Sedimentisphaera cyanobacteriorum]